MTIQIQNQNISAEINSLGAELISFKKNNHNYIWTIDEAFWNKASPVLFPIVGRLKNDSYTINNTPYSLPRHGFARNHEFEVIQKLNNTVTFSLKQNEQTLKQYPFSFELQLKYILHDNSLTISYLVVNHSEEKMPFAIGAHPAFAIDSNFEDHTLVFENDENLVSHQLENEAFSGKTKTISLEKNQLPLHYSLFEKDAIVLKNCKSKYLTILKNNNPYLKVIFESFPFLGIWTKPNAPFLCIEPWQGCADSDTANGDIFQKEGIQILNHNKEFNTSFSIEIL